MIGRKRSVVAGGQVDEKSVALRGLLLKLFEWAGLVVHVANLLE